MNPLYYAHIYYLLSILRCLHTIFFTDSLCLKLCPFWGLFFSYTSEGLFFYS